MAWFARVVLFALVVFPTVVVSQEWRELAERRNGLRRAKGLEPLSVTPSASKPGERCTVCHVDQRLIDDESVALADSGIFAPHPWISHSPTDFPCQSCHGGDGTQLDRDAAHLQSGAWGALLPRGTYQAGCGSCHSATSVAEPDRVLRGEALYRERQCGKCHDDPLARQSDGGPLTSIGMYPVDPSWPQWHRVDPVSGVDRGFIGYVGVDNEDDQLALTRYLETRIGAPQLENGKLLFHRRGCRSCHRVDDIGGDIGPALDGIGARRSQEFDFPPSWEGERSASVWLAEYLRDPRAMNPDATMPGVHRIRGEIDDLVVYLLSLRRSDDPLARQAPDRLRKELFGGREYETSGRNLYQMFCSSCHGPSGKGSWFEPTANSASAITHADFLGIVSDDFLVATIELGRRGRGMPGWASESGGLSAREIRNIVRYLRSFEPKEPSFEEVAAASADPVLGATLYAIECRACHGATSEGGIAPSHRSPAFRALATDRFLYESIVHGRPGTGMPAYREFRPTELASLIKTLREMAEAPAPDLDLLTLDVPLGDPIQGAKDYGEHCTSCHGTAGSGGVGPAIGNWAFQRAAGKTFVIETYRRARCRDESGKPPPPVGLGRLANAAAYLDMNSRRSGTTLRGPRAVGDAKLGRELYEKNGCADCHGARGVDGAGPAIAHPDFLSIATDGQIQATIVRGHRGTPMPRQPDDPFGFTGLSGQEVNHIVAFVRSLTPRR